MGEEEYVQFVDHTRGGLLVTSSTLPEDHRQIERIIKKKNFIENKEKLRRFFLEYPSTVGNETSDYENTFSMRYHKQLKDLADFSEVLTLPDMRNTIVKKFFSDSHRHLPWTPEQHFSIFVKIVSSLYVKRPYAYSVSCFKETESDLDHDWSIVFLMEEEFLDFMASKKTDHKNESFMKIEFLDTINTEKYISLIPFIDDFDHRKEWIRAMIDYVFSFDGHPGALTVLVEDYNIPFGFYLASFFLDQKITDDIKECLNFLFYTLFGEKIM